MIEAKDLLLGWRNPESSVNGFSCRSLDLCGFFFQFESSRSLLTNQITKMMANTIVHPSNKPAFLVFPVASISTFCKMRGLFLHCLHD